MNACIAPLTRFLLVALLIATTASVCAADEAGHGKRHVFLLVGQSNMAGRAKIEAEDEGNITGAELWNVAAKRWEPATVPFNRYSPHRKDISMQRLNPGFGFVKAYLKSNPGVTVGIVCVARGGTKIEQWKKGLQKPWPLYDTAVAATLAALGDGKGELKGILWHQGEGNAPTASAYPDLLRALVTNFREDFGQPELPFVYAQIGQWKADYAAFNAMIVKQPATIPATACVRTDGLKNFDNAHFDSAGQRTLGRRYAEAMGKLLQ